VASQNSALNDKLLRAVQNTFVSGMLVGVQIAREALELQAEGHLVDDETLDAVIQQVTEDYTVLTQDFIDDHDSPVMYDLAALRAQGIIERAKKLLREG
jgi:hypothetical protein